MTMINGAPCSWAIWPGSEELGVPLCCDEEHGRLAATVDAWGPVVRTAVAYEESYTNNLEFGEDSRRHSAFTAAVRALKSEHRP